MSSFFDKVVTNREQQEQYEMMNHRQGGAPENRSKISPQFLSSPTALSPSSRHSLLDSFDTRNNGNHNNKYQSSSSFSNRHHYTASTRNQRPSSSSSSVVSASPITPSIDNSSYDHSLSQHYQSTSSGNSIHSSHDEIPTHTLSMPYSRQSRAAYTNILDAP